MLSRSRFYHSNSNHVHLVQFGSCLHAVCASYEVALDHLHARMRGIIEEKTWWQKQYPDPRFKFRRWIWGEDEENPREWILYEITDQGVYPHGGNGVYNGRIGRCPVRSS